jgi:GTP-binding protein
MALWAIVGRPNVGKSTLFNRLVRASVALVSAEPNLTRDRLYGAGRGAFEGHGFIDTGGVGEHADQPLEAAIARQCLEAVREADGILWVVDCQSGLTGADEELAKTLRRAGKSVLLVANKSEGRVWAERDFDFTRIGMGSPVWVSARKGDGLATLALALGHLAAEPVRTTDAAPEPSVRVALIGRPNAGKSTLLNQLVGTERVLTSEDPGTTRDAVEVAVERQNRSWLLVDTAGIRSRTRIRDPRDRLAIARSLEAIARADLVTLVVDAREGGVDDDARLAGVAYATGRPLVVALNKWDGLSRTEKTRARRGVESLLAFLPAFEWVPVSALHGSGLGDLLQAWCRLTDRARMPLPTPVINRVLATAIREKPPALINRLRPKPRYGHAGGRMPLTIVIHGTRLNLLGADYERYLLKRFAAAFDLGGVPLKLEFRESADRHAHPVGVPRGTSARTRSRNRHVPA